ncbi:hypothetical protein DRV85_00630 [Rhodosalinus halophilus]|uniref:DUF4031 domain-containing protein n=1 Tax=Rhodosalinus halophilus TaxID=2259333 RepID=A0A365UF49_9RHOB|nr:DUF4031 domain-containing protein [Rhodosalinus halophilus]RBI87473.1 hypothetical protein DRV85_00630 [Rhodosalinus halophilus]
MADRLGLSCRWLQKPGTRLEHFDVSLSCRRKAVAAGAQEITMRELARKLRDRRDYPAERVRLAGSAPKPPRNGTQRLDASG